MLIPNVSYVQMALTLANIAISELKILRDFEEHDTQKLLSGPPFHNYALSLQFMLSMEITKLLERPSKKYPTNHEASIEKAGEALIENGIIGYSDNHILVIDKLNSIRESEFFKQLKELRDKKFAHSDGGIDNDPLKIPILNSDEISECMNMLVDLFSIWKEITNVLDYDFESRVPYKDVRTMNFLENHSVYKRYYQDHYLEAYKNGYP